MPIIRTTVILNKRSKVPRDAARNVWHWQTGAEPFDSFVVPIGEALEAFYDAIAPHLSPSIITGQPPGEGTIVEFSSVTFGAPGAGDDTTSELLATRTMDLPTVIGSTPLPSECAVAYSFQGAVLGVPEESGITRPRSRRRGRVFLGPLNTTALSKNGTTHQPEVSTTFRDAVGTGVVAMFNRLRATGTPPALHVVYSPTSGAVFPVQTSWVDNQFDTIRSRGEEASGRTEFVPIQPSL